MSRLLEFGGASSALWRGDKHWTEAEREFKRAIELNPSDATACQWCAEFLASEGKFTDALVWIKVAEEL